MLCLDLFALCRSEPHRQYVGGNNKLQLWENIELEEQQYFVRLKKF